MGDRINLMLTIAAGITDAIWDYCKRDYGLDNRHSYVCVGRRDYCRDR